MQKHVWMLVAGAICAVVAPAHGQVAGPRQAPMPKVLDLPSLPLLEDTTYPAAKEKAKRANRLLLIFWCEDPPSGPRWTFSACKNSIALRAYIKWHAVAIWMKTLPPDVADMVCACFPGGGGKVSPAVIVLRDGQLERVISSIDSLGTNVGVSRRIPCDPNGISWNPDDRIRVPHPIHVLGSTDVVMDCIAARDPVWMEIHNRDNPTPPPPPEREPANTIKDDLSPIVYDPKPEEHVGALDRLDEARRLMKSGDYYQATGIYTWLWERAAAADPAFRPAKLSALAQDLDTLMDKRPAALEKFGTIRDDRNERLPWAEYGQMHEWFVLNGVTRNPTDSLLYLDYFTNDPGEGGMIPPADARAFNLLSLRENFVKAWEMPKDPAGRVRRIADRVNPKFPSQVTEKERAEYRAFARQYLLDEGCRIYTACLVKGNEATAQQIADLILQSRNDHVARLSLIETALAADPPQARPIHERWLTEAEAAGGVPRPDLHNRLTFGIREPGISTPAAK